MRGLRNLIVLICELVIFALLVIFAVENIRPVQYTFLGHTFIGNVWWTVAGSALLGFLFALLMVGPGTLAARWRSRSLSRAHGRTEQELANLRGEHERLQAEHGRVLNERDRLQRSLTAMSTTSAAGTAGAANAETPTPAMATRSAPSDGASQPAPIERTDTSVQNTAQSTAPQAPAGVSDEANPPAEAEEAEQDTGWRGRLRRLREGSGETPDEMGTPNSPPAPTA